MNQSCHEMLGVSTANTLLKIRIVFYSQNHECLTGTRPRYPLYIILCRAFCTVLQKDNYQEALCKSSSGRALLCKILPCDQECGIKSYIWQFTRLGNKFRGQ
eukprot:c45780_g1_i1 orf=63-368(+)